MMNKLKPSTFHSPNMDQAALSRNLSQGFLFLLTVVAAGFVLKTGNTIFMIGLVALPFVLMIMNVPTWTLVCAICLDATLLPLPGLASSTLGYVAKFILAVTYVLAIMLGKWHRVPQRNVGSRMVVLYLAWLIILMMIRGSGFRILGSETWGGTRYIAHFVAIFMFFALNGMKLEKKQIKWIAWGSLIAGFIGSVLLGIGYGKGLFVTSTSEVVQARLSFLRPVFTALFPVIFALSFGRMSWFKVVVVIASLGLIAATGFRSLFVGAIVMATGFWFFRSQNKIAFFFKTIVVGLILWGLIVLVSSSLPMGMQRTISFVPGVRIDSFISENASNSIDWRVEIWGYCLAHSKEFLIIGRGMAFDVMNVVQETSQSDISNYTPWFAFETHAYHSGPLALLIDFGIPGFIIYSVFVIYAFKRTWGYAVRLSRLNSFEARYALFMCVSLLWGFVAFFLVFGGIQRIADTIFWFALYAVYAESILHQAEKRHLGKPPSEEDSIPLLEGE